MHPGTRRFVPHGPLSLCTESFGRPGDPPVLLVMGATASMLGWPDDFCRALADHDLHVLRFDHRDTGQSTTLPPGEATYSVEDLGADARAILDAHDLPTAHLVAFSLGGLIAQIAALRWPGRIASLSLIAAEPLGWDGAPLPALSDAFLAHFGALASLDWSDEAAVSAFLIGTERILAGPDFDPILEAARVRRVLQRTQSPASMFNHATLRLAEDWTGAFRRIACPTVVIHGDRDPILPLPNGRALAEGIPGASLRVLERTGHALPARLHQTLAARIAAQVRTA